MIAATHLNSQVRSAEALDRVYQLPKDTRSWSDLHRNRNLDLAGFDDVDLDRELFRVCQRLAYETDRFAREWLVARRNAVRQERRRRGQGVR